MSRAQPKRKPSASPVCYADEPGIAPGYMWAELPAKKREPQADSIEARKPRVKSKRKTTTSKPGKKSAAR